MSLTQIEILEVAAIVAAALALQRAITWVNGSFSADTARWSDYWRLIFGTRLLWSAPVELWTV
jgi:hypothetical protein